MSEGLNRVLLLGNLGADPELRVTAGGQSILKLRLATSETYLDRNDTRQERTEWHSVTMFGKRAEALARLLTKGERVFIEGSLRTSSYEKDGEKRYRTEVVATNIILSGRGGAADVGESEHRARGFSQEPLSRHRTSRYRPGAAGAPSDAEVVDDIPF